MENINVSQSYLIKVLVVDILTHSGLEYLRDGAIPSPNLQKRVINYLHSVMQSTYKIPISRDSIREVLILALIDGTLIQDGLKFKLGDFRSETNS